MPRTITQLCSISIIAALGAQSHAQWIDDSTMHVVVADGPGEQVQPKIAPTADGGCYISWFSSVSGYDVRLQRLDASGNELWADNGILIADRGFSSTQEYDLDVDASGHAVLVFRDDRFGGTLITAQRIAPDGTATWGANGIQFGNGTDFVASPDIATTTDGNTVIGWINEGNSNLSQIDPTGAVQWNTVISEAGASINLASMHGSDNGTVILSWVQFESFFGPKDLYAQKIAADGSEVWASSVPVFNNGSLQFGNFPEFVSDGSGGAVFSWYDTANSLDVYIQRLNTNGLNVFVQNGFAASTNPRERVNPSVAFDFDTDSIYVAWTELDNNQGSQGLYAQHINASGNRVWSDDGKMISPIDVTPTGSANAQVIDGNFAALWIENTGGFNQDVVLAHAAAPDGTDLWPTGNIRVASNIIERSRLTSAVSSDGFIIAGWQAGATGVADIETHNINPDGSIGVTSCLPDLNGDDVLDFFDVSFFLSNTIDYNGDTVFDFFDVSAFLSDFGAGCP